MNDPLADLLRPLSAEQIPPIPSRLLTGVYGFFKQLSTLQPATYVSRKPLKLHCVPVGLPLVLDLELIEHAWLVPRLQGG